MTDIWDSAKRSDVMSKIRSKNTKPELTVRRALHALGFRFRIHDTKLPGKPDIVLAKHRAIVLVQGCFWHAHGCRISKIPASNRDYWELKLARNQERDRKNIETLQGLGWRVLIVWECNLESGLLETIRALRDDTDSEAEPCLQSVG